MNNLKPTDMGGAEIGALASLMQGNVALFFCLVLTLFGLYQILVARNTSLGLIMLVVGLILPFVANIMGGLQDAFCPFIQAVGGSCASFTGLGGGASLSGGAAI